MSTVKPNLFVAFLLSVIYLLSYLPLIYVTENKIQSKTVKKQLLKGQENLAKELFLTQDSNSCFNIKENKQSNKNYFEIPPKGKSIHTTENSKVSLSSG